MSISNDSTADALALGAQAAGEPVCDCEQVEEPAGPDNPMLAAALDYVGRGWHVLPLQPGSKVPLASLVSHGRLEASVDPETVTDWWSRYPDANIGIACEASGLVVVDVDIYKEDCNWRDFACSVDLPDTLEQRTGRGGTHYVFKANGTAYAGKLPRVNGVDVLHRHYFVAEPSQVQGRRYQWLTDDEPAMAPAWLPRTAEGPSGSGNDDRTADELLRGILSGEALHPSLVPLSARLIGRGIDPETTLWLLRSLMEASDCPRDARWQDRYADLPRIVESAARKFGTTEDGEIPSDEELLSLLTSPADLTGEPPPREWIVENWIPSGCVTLLAGGGGLGKSLLGQQLCTAAAAGRPWLGLTIRPCRSLYFACEDEAAELHRRQVNINAAMEIDRTVLSGFRWQSRVGMDNTLFEVVHGKAGHTTARFAEIERMALASGSRLVVIDNAAQTFAGNEIQRTEVTQYINALQGLASRIGGAVVLLAHPGKAEKSEYSGSTAWEAAVRSRLFLGCPAEDSDAPDAQDLRVLRRSKTNYARAGVEISLKWEGGAFRGLDPALAESLVDSLEKAKQDRADEVAFLKALDAARDQGRAFSEKPCATYAPSQMLGMAETKGIGKERLKGAMDRLFAAGMIKAGQRVTRRADRKWSTGIACVEWLEEEAEAPEFGRATPAPDLKGGTADLDDDEGEAAKSARKINRMACANQSCAGRAPQPRHGGSGKAGESSASASSYGETAVAEVAPRSRRTRAAHTPLYPTDIDSPALRAEGLSRTSGTDNAGEQEG